MTILCLSRTWNIEFIGYFFARCATYLNANKNETKSVGASLTIFFKDMITYTLPPSFKRLNLTVTVFPIVSFMEQVWVFGLCWGGCIILTTNKSATGFHRRGNCSWFWWKRNWISTSSSIQCFFEHQKLPCQSIFG